MTDDYPDDVVVLATLTQSIEAMCPVTGERRRSSREFEGLTKEQLVLYGDDWLDVEAADIPSSWLVRIKQHAVLTSEQLPGLKDWLDLDEFSPWLPRAAAISRAKGQLRRFARLKRWGGSR